MPDLSFCVAKHGPDKTKQRRMMLTEELRLCVFQSGFMLQFHPMRTCSSVFLLVPCRMYFPNGSALQRTLKYHQEDLGLFTPFEIRKDG